MTYNDSWDCPHSPTTDDLWQESDCYWFFDREAGVGGYHRIGHYPNRGTGQVLLNAFKRDGQRFRFIDELGNDACGRTETGQVVGSSSVQALGAGEMQFSWEEPECGADLEFHEPFYTPRDWMSRSNKGGDTKAVEEKMNTGGHLECSGRIRGSVRIGDETIKINALAHRDRSWGARDYKAAYQHRMVTGTEGPDLSWATFVMRLSGGIYAHAGFVARNGVTTDIRRVDIISEFADDGLTVAGMRARIHLPDGEKVDVRGPAAEGFCALTEGWLLSSHHYIECGDTGFTIFDTTNRPSKGDYVPAAKETAGVCIENGLSACGDYSRLRF